MTKYNVYFSRDKSSVYISTFHSLAAAKRCCEKAFCSGDEFGTDLRAAYVEVVDSRGSARWYYVFRFGVWSRRSFSKKVVKL